MGMSLAPEEVRQVSMTTMTRNFLVSVIAAAAVASGASAQTAATFRIGVVDMARVAQEYRRYTEAQKILEGRKGDLQETVTRQEEEVVSLIEELDRIRATAAPEEIQRRRRAIEDRDRDLADFVDRTNRELRDNLFALQLRTRQEVETTVAEVSREAGVALVLEKNFSLFAAADLDLTDRVIERLNRRFAVLPAAQAIPPLPEGFGRDPAEGGPGGRTAWPEPRREGFRTRPPVR
jgi:Skp family chaperone for outer membrane proteins